MHHSVMVPRQSLTWLRVKQLRSERQRITGPGESVSFKNKPSNICYLLWWGDVQFGAKSALSRLSGVDVRLQQSPPPVDATAQEISSVSPPLPQRVCESN